METRSPAPAREGNFNPKLCLATSNYHNAKNFFCSWLSNDYLFLLLLMPFWPRVSSL
jgi:hypothetical protein